MLRYCGDAARWSRAAVRARRAAWGPLQSEGPRGTEIQAADMLCLHALAAGLAFLQSADGLSNCGQAGEGGDWKGRKYPREVTLGCPDGAAITGITFASYGLPTGQCGGPDPLSGTGNAQTFRPGATCAVDGKTVATDHCLGKTECTIDCGPPGSGGGNKVFQKDPCVGTIKHCAIVVACPQDPCAANPALCSYIDTGGDDDWGWSFILILLLVVALYAGGGLAYNHKQRGMPLEAASLPHVEFWKEVRALTTDGIVFFRARVEEARMNNGAQRYDALGEATDVGNAQSHDQPLAKCPPPRKKTSEVAPEQISEEGEDDQWEMVGRDMREVAKKGVHSSQAPIRVEIQRSDVGPAMPWEGVE